MGGTGDPPVPSGHWPDGRKAMLLSRWPHNSQRTSAPVPCGESPHGTGESPVLPVGCAAVASEFGFNWRTAVVSAAQVVRHPRGRLSPVLLVHHSVNILICGKKVLPLRPGGVSRRDGGTPTASFRLGLGAVRLRLRCARGVRGRITSILADGPRLLFSAACPAGWLPGMA